MQKLILIFLDMLNRYSQCRLETLRNLNNFQTIGKTLFPGTSVPSKGQ